MKHLIHHVITGLDIGGAELVLLRLVTSEGLFKHTVTSLTETGALGDRLAGKGVSVESLAMGNGVGVARGILELRKSIRTRNPALVQTWLYHADFAGGLAAWRSGIPVVWNLRQTDVDPGAHKLNTRIVIRLCARLSRFVPRAIVCGSSSARTVHEKLGFDPARMTVIRNGVDTHEFSPDPSARRCLRNVLQIPEEQIVVGRIARFHPQKDFETFIDMARRVADRRPGVTFLLAGRNVTAQNLELMEWIRNAGLEDRCHLLGERTDTPKVLAGLDILVSSSSFGEGFPNVIAEAMACGIPCVATDVGDSAEIIGDDDRIAVPRDADGLGRMVLKLLSLTAEERVSMGRRDRRRVTAGFALDDMIQRYETLYSSILENGKRGVPEHA
ncbi:MAG: glycosyltransferase [Gammaproteobacteria bacterium]|nr:glycosyltransferase [Gammaproteobacteria bacterium]